ncbi:hypothetical protein E4U39_004849 [Claviceps sp. Clav50 group G5]|nr:hypothetical protein E4U39_004849 [Claviceps sp. Clav50 group G5]
MSGAFDLSFWTIDVPRVTRAHPAIWHASASLIAMYKYVQHRDRLVEKENLYKFSVLFTSICILQGDQEMAKIHVDRGIELFNYSRFWGHVTKLPNTDDVSAAHSLVALFTRFELESSFAVPPKPFFQAISFDERQAHVVFISATEAYYEQQQLLKT